MKTAISERLWRRIVISLCLFWALPTFAHLANVDDLAKACLQSADNDAISSRLLTGSLKIDKIDGENLLLDSEKMEFKIQAYELLFKDSIYGAFVVNKIGAEQKKIFGIPPVSGLKYNYRNWIEYTADHFPIYPTTIAQDTEERIKADHPAYTDIFANAQAKFAPYSCDFVLDAKAPDYAERRRGCMQVAEFLLGLTATIQMGGEQTSFVPVFKRAMNERVYGLALTHLAKLLMAKMDRVEQNREAAAHGTQNFGDLFDDATDAFLQADPASGRNVAVDRAFDLMAMYGARGVGFSFMTWVSGPENIVVWPSLQVIASSLTVLNRASAFSGKPYALPSFANTHCNLDRPYHFWMSAYLAREAARIHRFDNKDILSAIHALQTAYKVVGPTSAWTTITDPDYGQPYAHETQKDLTLGALAVYALLKSPDLSFGKLDGQALPPLAVDKIMMSQWNASNFAAKADGPSFLDNLAVLIQPFAKSYLSQYDSSADRLWNAGVAPNYTYRLLLKRL